MSEFDDLARRAQELEDENRRLRTTLFNLERSYDIALESFGVLDLRDGSGGGHSKRVTAFSIGIVRAMGLPIDQTRMIARGAMLHDIGKVAIADAILRKPGSLSHEEIVTVHEHPRFGYLMLLKFPFLVDPAEIVYSHHERYDGGGYPRRLKGQQIPLGARIVAVANTLDSITSDLPYRSALPFQAARREIGNWSGRQFDPEVVTVFQQMPVKIFEELRSLIIAEANS